MPELTFNIDHGYLEGLVRGFKAGILTQTDYLNLVNIQKQNKRLWHIAQINKKFKLMYSMLKRWLGKKVTEFSIVWESCYVKLSDCIPLKTREIFDLE
jgi:hypothetical protein